MISLPVSNRPDRPVVSAVPMAIAECFDRHGTHAYWTTYDALRDARDLAKSKTGQPTKLEALVNGEEPWSLSTKSTNGREKSKFVQQKEADTLVGYLDRLYGARTIVRVSVRDTPGTSILGYRVDVLDERDVVTELAKYDVRWSLSALDGLPSLSLIRFADRRVVSIGDWAVCYVVEVTWPDETAASHNNAMTGFLKLEDAIKFAVERERW